MDLHKTMKNNVQKMHSCIFFLKINQQEYFILKKTFVKTWHVIIKKENQNLL